MWLALKDDDIRELSYFIDYFLVHQIGNILGGNYDIKENKSKLDCYGMHTFFKPCVTFGVLGPFLQHQESFQHLQNSLPFSSDHQIYKHHFTIERKILPHQTYSFTCRFEPQTFLKSEFQVSTYILKLVVQEVQEEGDGDESDGQEGP